jgi:phosphopantetheinyl transferase
VPTAMPATTDCRWTPAPPHPRATEGTVHVWRADLVAVGDEFEDLLCADELARAARIVPVRNRVLWARSRGVLRALLGRYLDADPRELRFELGTHGKPALRRDGAEPGVATDLRFNLSHSGPLALYAVSAGREVGVDIECARERYTAEFLRAWVTREAAVKCLGTGLASMQVEPDPDPTAGLWTTKLPLGPQATAAVAVEGGEQCELRCWDWRA